jgi:hypothetical protein
MERAMQTYEPRAILLASAVWVIFAVGIVFSSPPAPGERGWDLRTSDKAGHRLMLAASAALQAKR